MRYTSSKAVAGAVAANLVTIALWLISLAPGWESIPDEPKAAIIALVAGAIGWAVVYFSPANTIKVSVYSDAEPSSNRNPVVVA